MLFKNIVGHAELKQSLIQNIKNGRVSHAQFFLGKEGGGNFQLALAYARYINCLNPSDEDACGECASCKKYDTFQHPDLYFIYPTAIGSEVKEKPSSAKYTTKWIEFLKEYEYFNLDDWTGFIGIDNKLPIINKLDSEDIIKKLSLKNYEANYKVMIIWWPEKMNIDCSNKILKVLEEPADKTLFILVGHNSEELLTTIISRVQILKIKDLTELDIRQGLLDKEGVPEELANSLANLSEGSFQSAVHLVKNPEGDEYFMQAFQALMRLCYGVKIIELNDWVEEVAKMGRERQKKFLEYALRVLRECIVYNYASPEMNKLHHNEEKFVAKFSKFVHGGNINALTEIFSHTHTAIIRNGNPKIAFMNLCLKVCNYLRYKP